MDVFTAIKERRACRKFLAEPVSEESIEKILRENTACARVHRQVRWRTPTGTQKRREGEGYLYPLIFLMESETTYF
jgi:hypothetical protein